MEHLQFTSAIARIRVLETKLLDKSKIEKMIESSSADDALKILGETEYGNEMSNAKKTEDYEKVLNQELKRIYNLAYEISPEKSIIDIMALKYDYHNIKVIIKGKKLEKNLSYLLIPTGNIKIDRLKQIFSDDNFENLSSFMREAIQKVELSFDENKDPQQIDIILDDFMYREMLYMAEHIGEGFIQDYLKISIDLINIKTFLRVKTQNRTRKFLNEVLIEGGVIDKKNLVNLQNESIDNISSRLSNTPYEKIIKLGLEMYAKNNDISYLEKLSENYIMNFVKKAKYISFGIEPLIAYIIAKEMEIKLIRIIMVGKLNNISPEVIRERLRDTYV